MTTTALFELLGRKSLNLKNRLVKPHADEIKLLDDMLRMSPQNRTAVQEWAAKFADLLESQLFDRVSRRDLALIFAGLVSYRNTGVTPEISHLALMRAYENSSGILQQMLHRILFVEADSKAPYRKSEFFGEIPHSEMETMLSELDRQGYVVFPKLLDLRWVDALTAEAATFGYALRNPGAEERDVDNRKVDPVNPPRCVAAYAKPADLAASQLFTDFSNDPLLVYLASRHLNAAARPIDVTLWYSFASAAPSADAAQLFHYDLDTLRWLKVFVYLTDVGPDNGPHEYVPATHQPGAKPHQLTVRGYGRLEDREIDKYCRQGRKAIQGRRGTVILGDTRCFHKGNSVKSGYRLILSPIYAASKIGYVFGT